MMNGSEIVSILLILIVEAYFVHASWQVLKKVIDFQKNINDHIKVSGKIETLTETGTVKKGRMKLHTAYPIYACHTEHGIKRTMGLIRYPTEQLEKNMNHEIPLVYDRKTGRIWNVLEIPILKRELIKKVLCMTLLLVAVMLAGKLMQML